MDLGEEVDWIVAQARDRGIALSRRQLAEWHRAGLIPEPKRDYRGRPEGGSVSVYPAGTLAQALACRRLLSGNRNFEYAGWRLWIEGFEVREDLWRRPLVEAQALFRSTVDHLENDGAGDDQQSAVIEAVQSQSQIMRVVRRQIRDDDLKVMLVSRVIASVIGAFVHTDDEESSEQKEAFERLFGMARTIDDRFHPEDVAIQLNEMTDRVSRIALWDLSTLNLNKAVEFRKEYIAILDWATDDIERYGAASRVLRGILKPMLAMSARDQAVAILLWMAVRDMPNLRRWLVGLAL